MNRFILLVFICIILSCSNSLKERELAVKERELELREKALETNSTSSNELDQQNKNDKYKTKNYTNNTKYMYVEIETNEPELKVIEEPKDESNLFSDMVPTRYTRYYEPHTHVYSSKIVTIDNYTEDKKYQEMDDLEQEVKVRLSQVNLNLEINSNGKQGSPIPLQKATITRRTPYVFDTYREASKRKSGEN